MSARRKKSVWRDDAGAVAIEFALLAPAVFLLILIIFEIVTMLAAQSVLDKTVLLAARELRTNQPTAAGSNLAQRIRTLACADVALLDCQDKLQIQVAAFDALEDMGPLTAPDPATTPPGNAWVEASSPGAYIVMRLDYPWEFIFPGLGALAGGNAGQVSGIGGAPVLRNYIMLSSVTAFRREY